METEETQPQKFIKAVYEHLEHWYENADRKAQIVLVLDGIFLSFITSNVFSASNEVKTIVADGGFVTIGFLVVMVIFLAASILSAIACLHPRLHTKKDHRKETLLKEANKTNTSEPIPAKLFWFFGYLSKLNQERVTEQLKKVDNAYANEALACEIAKFSGHVYLKHKWVNRAFLCIGISLIFLLLASISYWINVACRY